MAKNYSVLLIASLDPRRLKTPAAMLPFGDRTVLRATIEAYESLEPREIVVVSSSTAEAIQAAIEPDPGRVTIVNSPEILGHVGLALRLGLERMQTEPDALVLGLGDQPLLKAPLVREIATAYEASDTSIGVPVCQGIPGHPIFVPSRFISEMRSLEGQQSHRHLLLQHPDEVLDIDTDETAVLRTIDDPDSYRELLALAGLPIPEEGIEGAGESTADSRAQHQH